MELNPSLPEIRVRPVPGLGGYSVSERGQVFGRQAQAIKPHWHHGYLCVQVRLARGDKRRYPVHRLVLMAFVGLPEAPANVGMHVDGDLANNCVTNLRWGSRADVGKASVKRGTAICLRRGEQHPAAKLTDADVATILRAKASGSSPEELAERYGVGVARIRQLWRGVMWTFKDPGVGPEFSGFERETVLSTTFSPPGIPGGGVSPQVGQVSISAPEHAADPNETDAERVVEDRIDVASDKHCIESPPAHLCGEAAEEWDRVADQVLAHTDATPIARAVLSVYCTSWGRYSAAETELAATQEPKSRRDACRRDRALRSSDAAAVLLLQASAELRLRSQRATDAERISPPFPIASCGVRSEAVN